jgi:hypothetical protein
MQGYGRSACSEVGILTLFSPSFEKAASSNALNYTSLSRALYTHESTVDSFTCTTDHFYPSIELY